MCECFAILLDSLFTNFLSNLNSGGGAILLDSLITNFLPDSNSGGGGSYCTI